MPTRGRKRVSDEKVSSKANLTHKVAVSSENAVEIKSSRSLRKRAPKNAINNEVEASMNHCELPSKKGGKNIGRKRTRVDNVIKAETIHKETEHLSNSGGTGENCSISRFTSDQYVKNNVSKISDVSSHDSSDVSKKELKILIKKVDNCSPRKKKKTANGVSNSMSSGESVVEDVRESENIVNRDPSCTTKTSKKGRSKIFKPETEDVNKAIKTSSRKKTKVSHSTSELECEVHASAAQSEISSKKHLPLSSDPSSSLVKAEIPMPKTEVGVTPPSSSGKCSYVSKAKLVQDNAEPSTSRTPKRHHEDEADGSASSSESEWEEVEDHDEPSLDDYKPDIPKEGVEITLENPLMKKGYRRKKFDMAGFVRLQINRFKKDVQMALHKVHLLCLLGHGLYLNEILNSCEIKALALSLLPAELFSITKNQNKIDSDVIFQIVKWFSSTFTIDAEFKPSASTLLEKLLISFATQKAADPSQLNIIFVAFARTLGINVRLCYSLYPLTFKAKGLLKKAKSGKGDDDKEKGDDDFIHKITTKGAVKKRSHKTDIKKIKKCDRSSKQNDCNKNFQNSKRSSKFVVEKSAPPKKSVEKQEKVSKSKVKAFVSKSKVKASVSKKQPSSVKRPRLSKQNKSYKISSDENDDYDDTDADSDFVGSADDAASDDDDDDDFVAAESGSDCGKSVTLPSPQKLKPPEIKQIMSSSGKPKKRSSSCKQNSGKGKNRKILSSDSEESSDQSEEECISSGIEFWSEIYSKSVKRWIPVETSCKLVNKPYEIELVARQPVSYVVVFDNKSRIKDVTRRYCSEFLTVTRKLQPDPEWWEDTLDPFLPPNNKQDKDEDQQLTETLCNRPLPTTMSEVKSHPLYVIKPHLLKYEALYPPDAAPVGYLRGEPIYSRDCVFVLHNREKWMKEARVVREGEQPYKMVKSRPKWDKINRRIIKTEELPLVEVFGHWQTEQFVPPTARDGKVPRNEYGNVELFKPSMLPKGTVHLQVPGLNRIAKKLDIDCAPALTGFDVHNLGIHPVFDGWIVCKEFKETLLAAWDEEQENIRKREQEKREKRIYGNWKKLIKGLLIRERIRVKYALK